MQANEPSTVGCPRADTHAKHVNTHARVRRQRKAFLSTSPLAELANQAAVQWLPPLS